MKLEPITQSLLLRCGDEFLNEAQIIYVGFDRSVLEGVRDETVSAQIVCECGLRKKVIIQV
jgi:hypothetical protein